MTAFKRILGILLGSAMLFLILLACLIIWLTTTESGTQAWSKNLQTRWPQLHMQNLRGTLVDGFYAEHLVFAGTQRIEVDKLRVDLSLWPLLDLQALEVNHLHAEAVRVMDNKNSVTTQTQDFRAFPADRPLPALPSLANVLHTLHIPKPLIPVQIHNLNLQHVSIDNFVIDDVLLNLSWNRQQLHTDKLNASIAGLFIDARVSVTTDDIPGVSLAGRWQRDQVFAEVNLDGTFTRLAGSHHLHWTDGALMTEGSVDLMPDGLLHTNLTHTSVTPDISFKSELTGNGIAWRGTARGHAYTHPFTAQLTGRITPVIGIVVEQALISKNVSASGTFDYVDDAPRIQAKAVVGNLADWLPGFQGTAESEFTWEDGAFAIEAAGQKVQIQTYALHAVQLSAQGNIDQVRYQAVWDQGQFAGTIESLQNNPIMRVDAGAQVRHDNFNLSNQQAFSVHRSGQTWHVSAHCWHGIGEICVTPTQLDSDRSEINGTLSDLTLELLNPYLPVKIDPGSEVSGTWQAQFQPGDWQVAGRLSTQNFALEYERRTPPLPDIDLTFTADATKAFINAEAANQHISWHGEFSSIGYSAQSSISGRLTVQTQPSWLAGMVPAINQIDGFIDAVVEIEGSINAPRLTAQGQWSSGTLAWQAPEFELNNINAQIQASPEYWQISGVAVPETGGTLNVSAKGDGYTQSAEVTADLTGKGLTLEADNWRVNAAPDVTLIYADNDVQITGRTDIPEALIELSTLPGNLPRPVDDVKIMDRPAIPRDNDQTLINGKVDVRLGDNVLLELLALKVRLTGELSAELVDSEVTGLYGELNIADGSLAASGQSLRVQEGRLLFSGNPNNPYVDLIAVRTITDQTPPLNVGLRISGRADNLKTVVYSDPAMSETRALSFLVLGRDFNEQSETDSQQLMIAAIGFGLSQTQGVVQQLRDNLGLDELSALAAEQNDIAIVAGKRINDNLYVRYSYNALSAVGALIIRYYLTDRWRLEATNDLNSSMDLLYELRR